MKKTINVGIAGFGMSGQVFQAPFLYTDKRFAIKKVYERKTSLSKERYPFVEIVRTFEELLTDDIDLIIISTPNSMHYSMAKQAMLVGKNVIVEKPLSITSIEAEDLIAISKQQNVLLSVYQNRRWDGDFLTVKKLLKECSLGTIVDYESHFDRYATGKSTKAWKNTSEIGAGVLYDLGVHLIDQAVDLFGIPNAVYADLRIQREESSSEDNFQVYLYYLDKKAVLSASQLVKEKGPHYMIHGTKGSFIKYGMDAQEEKLIVGELPNSEDWGVDKEENWGVLNTCINGEDDRSKIRTEIGDYHYYYDNIYKVLTENAELAVKPEQAKDVIRILEAAMESNEKGCKIIL